VIPLYSLDFSQPDVSSASEDQKPSASDPAERDATEETDHISEIHSWKNILEICSMPEKFRDDIISEMNSK
jgi:hypothetical protein